MDNCLDNHLIGTRTFGFGRTFGALKFTHK